MVKQFSVTVTREKINQFETAVQDCGIHPSHKICGENETQYIFTAYTTVTDERACFLMGETLIYLYPMAEATTPESTSIQQVLNEEATITAYELIKAYVGKIITEDKSNKVSHKIKSYCQDMGLNILNHRPWITFQENNMFGGILTSSINTENNLIEPTSNKPPIHISFSISEDEFKNHENCFTSKGKRKANKFKSIMYNVKPSRGNRNINMNEVAANCHLFRTYTNGSQIINGYEFFVLQSALSQVDSGKSMHNKILNVSGLSDVQKHALSYQFDMIRLSNVGTVKCKDDTFSFICPFFNECRHNVHMLQQAGAKRGEVRYIGDYTPRKEVADAFQEYTDVLKNAYQADDKMIHVLKAPTGIGKTEAMLSLNLDNVAIALPTHELCREVYHRLKDAGHDFLLMPERPMLPSDLEDQFMALQRVGLYKKANRIFFKYSNQLNKKQKKLLTNEEQSFLNYINALKKMNTASKIIITHQRLLNLKNKNIKTYIIDEDILLTSMLKTVTISETNIKDIIMTAPLNIMDGISGDYDKTMIDTFSQFLFLPVDCFYTKKEYFDRKLLEEYIFSNKEHIQDNVLDFLQSNYYLSTQNRDRETFIHTVKLQPLDAIKQKTIIVMSATVNRFMYQKVFKERLNFIDIGQTVTKGRILWHSDKSFSRSQFIKHINFKEICDSIGRTNVITYKRYKNQLSKEGLNVVATFGATAGLDKYKGEDLVVIGSPYTYREVYLLIAKELGIEVTDDDIKNENYVFCPVNRNGYDFSCVTFKQNKHLQEVQFAFIESELMQAVGRARILRYDCTVKLYSKIPVPGALLA
ncbi:hypothetical protein [Ectobacillus sp. sgz5001026]|uniref:hypothetical protein n=1 Tax=Ectobacillus sp. sgz5001026 TaxID=3242473 RepID=UPI0036D24213